MNARAAADDPGILSVAKSISDGVPVDWKAVVAERDATTTAVLDELRVLEGVSKLGDPMPARWGEYTILGEVGHGAYGTVYRAHDENLNLEVALKVIRPREPARFLNPDRALNDARLLAQLRHDNVVRIYGAHRVGGDVGIAMELLHGRTLAELLAAHGPFNAREAMLFGVDVCRALAAVHHERLVHGDVKAQNVMRAAGGRTVLMDFGAGYDVKTDEAAGRRLAGTPLYLAPEVFDGEPRTTQGDIYSVGVLLFHLVTGAYPVEGQTGADVRRQHQAHAPRRRLRDLRPELPDVFIQVVERATAAQPSDRYQTAGELEAALNLALGHKPRQDDTKPEWPRILKFAIAAGVVAVIAGIGYWRSRDTSTILVQNDPPTAATAAAGTVTTVSPAAADGSYRIEAAFYRHDAGRDVRLASGSRVAPGDRLSLRVASSVPTYVYVVNEDEQGESYLLFPMPGMEVVNPLPPGSRHEIPGAVDGETVYWTVSSTGGREHFLIFASPEPLSQTFQRLFDALPRPRSGAGAPAQRLSPDLVGVLRGVGGLAKAPPPATGPGLRGEFSTPLLASEETARGVWVRQLTLDNPKP
jgi:serine/threonine protein kinase